ncbi:MAG: hypothetical protein R2838_03570 [Caldilineaceae bacterium]
MANPIPSSWLVRHRQRPLAGHGHRAHNDENGIKWPITIAPYQVVLVSLATASSLK